jgi:hypothetical protein
MNTDTTQLGREDRKYGRVLCRPQQDTIEPESPGLGQKNMEKTGSNISTQEHAVNVKWQYPFGGFWYCHQARYATVCTRPVRLRFE